MPDNPEPDALFDAFSGWSDEQGLALYPAQQDALIEVFSGSNVILSTPTGSGKSLVAVGAHFAALATKRRTYYTAPIKALVSEKFFALAATFGADKVGMMTGDAAVNPRAPIICCTAEILANLALRGAAGADVVVMDEFHFYSEPDRGWAWQVPLLELAHSQFLLMSATLGDVTRFETELTERTGRATAVISGAERPVPLFYSYAMTPLHETIEDLLATGQAPIYIVHFTQQSAVERAQALMSINVCSREEKDAIADLIGSFRFTKGFGPTLSRLVRHGIGVHHAGMLPKYRRLVELLAQAGLLKVICGTDTLGVGINVPIRTVLFTALSKYDGDRTRHLKAREFHQIAGRAGRAGYDTAGTVVVQAPEHDVENAKSLAKAGDDPKRRRKVVRRTPPEGFVSWGEPTFERLVKAEPETLTSSFALSHAMVLNVLHRAGDDQLRQLIERTHESDDRKQQLLEQSEQIVEALVAADVVERDADGRLVLTVELQPDFALNQPLSPFAVAALQLLDRDSPSFSLDVLSVLEATLEDPRQVLSAQRSKARGEAVAQMKAAGIEYEERLELLEEVDHPKPLAELLGHAFETYRETQPWVADYELAPKSVARDMYERAMTFVEYVGFYGLARSEGLVLRYLADAYKALDRTVPDALRNDELIDLTEWLGELVRQVDSSLLDEWEALRNPGEEQRTAPVDTAPPPVTANPRAFRVLVRNAMFRRVELAALWRPDLLAELDPDIDWAAAIKAYFDEYDRLGTGPDARGPHLLVVDQQPARWIVRQIFDDPNGDHDWGISAEVDLAASDQAGSAVLRVLAVGPH
ncbi:MAG: DEAD/DEAH box helicase [Mycobacteriales bacterium]